MRDVACPSSEVHRVSAPTEGLSSQAGGKRLAPCWSRANRFASLSIREALLTIIQWELLQRFAAVREEKALTALSSD